MRKGSLDYTIAKMTLSKMHSSLSALTTMAHVYKSEQMQKLFSEFSHENEKVMEV